MKQFFESIPPSVEEAAHIDGAGPFRTFSSVTLPMSRPALITLTSGVATLVSGTSARATSSR